MSAGSMHASGETRSPAPVSSRRGARQRGVVRALTACSAVVSVVLAVVFGLVGVAGATTVTPGGVTQPATRATTSISGGSLSFVSTPSTIKWSYTESGLGVHHLTMVGGSESLDVDDARGSGTGWSVDLTSTLLHTSTGHDLPATVASVQAAPTYSCVTTDVASCTLGSDTISYPYVVPAAATAPTSTVVASAAAGTGMGAQSVKVPFVLTIPSNAYAGTYTASWTFTLVSGP